MSQPYEIVWGPAQVYLAPTGTAFPDVDETPANPWSLLGTTGGFRYDEGGVTLAQPQTMAVARTLKSTGGVKVMRTAEELQISLVLKDLALEQYRRALNNVAVQLTAAGAGTPGQRKVTLRRGPDVTLFALILRGPSPYGDSPWVADYRIPYCYEGGSPSLVFSKANPVGIALMFAALEDPNAASDAERFGVFMAQDATAI